VPRVRSLCIAPFQLPEIRHCVLQEEEQAVAQAQGAPSKRYGVVVAVRQRQALLVGGGLERDWIGATDKAHRPPLGGRAGSETKGKGRQMVLQQQPAAMR
jgi:hypothetical protein